MGKPFRLKGQQSANVGRSPDGKFTKLEDKTPGELLEAAQKAGTTVQAEAAKAAAPMHEVGSETPADVDGDAVYPPSIPWPKVESPSPMKLKQG